MVKKRVVVFAFQGEGFNALFHLIMRAPHPARPAQRSDLDCDRYDCHPTVDKGLIQRLRTFENNRRGADTVTRKDHLKTYIVVDCADRRSRNLNSRDTRLQTL